jgi:hypothetical protein
VRIEECAPVSKLKSWTVLDRIGAAKAVAIEINEPETTMPEAAPAKPAKETAEKPAKTAAKKSKAKAEDVADADA